MVDLCTIAKEIVGSLVSSKFNNDQFSKQTLRMGSHCYVVDEDVAVLDRTSLLKSFVDPFQGFEQMIRFFDRVFFNSRFCNPRTKEFLTHDVGFSDMEYEELLKSMKIPNPDLWRQSSDGILTDLRSFPVFLTLTRIKDVGFLELLDDIPLSRFAAALSFDAAVRHELSMHRLSLTSSSGGTLLLGKNLDDIFDTLLLLRQKGGEKSLRALLDNLQEENDFLGDLAFVLEGYALNMDFHYTALLLSYKLKMPYKKVMQALAYEYETLLFRLEKLGWKYNLRQPLAENKRGYTIGKQILSKFDFYGLYAAYQISINPQVKDCQEYYEFHNPLWLFSEMAKLPRNMVSKKVLDNYDSTESCMLSILNQEDPFKNYLESIQLFEKQESSEIVKETFRSIHLERVGFAPAVVVMKNWESYHPYFFLNGPTQLPFFILMELKKRVTSPLHTKLNVCPLQSLMDCELCRSKFYDQIMTKTEEEFGVSLCPYNAEEKELLGILRRHTIPAEAVCQSKNTDDCQKRHVIIHNSIAELD